MSTADSLEQTLWWQPPSTRLTWQGSRDPANMARMIRMLLDPDGPEPAVLAVARVAMAELEACFAGTRAERDERLHALWQRHAASTVPATQRIGVPSKLWDRLLAFLGASKPAGKRRWLGSSEREGMLHQGMALGRCVEWWGHPAAPGAVYDDRLWAWGAVQELPGPLDSVAELSERLVWRPDRTQWIVHPRLARALAEHGANGSLPRVEDGPGYLLACVVDALAELLHAVEYTSRDLAVLWATMLLPVLAPSTAFPGSTLPRGPDAFLDGEPDYLQSLAFFMLHPRIQSALVVLDHLCTLLLVEDHASMHELLGQLGRASRAASTAPGAVVDAIWQLICEVARHALHRQAADRWDSGFGFKLFRKLLRDVLAQGPHDFVRLWDAAVHRNADDAQAQQERDAAGLASRELGALAQRLREALSTALWFPGRPPYPGGPAVQQLLDLVWLRWTDEDFLR